MVRKAQEDTLTIGFFGGGEVSQEAVEAHLDDYLSTQPDNVTFVVPVVKTMWTDTMSYIVEYAQEHDIPYIAVHDEVSAKARNLSKYLKAAAETDEGAKIGLKISNRIIAAGKENKENALLGMAWADDDKELNDVCERIAKAGIPVREFATKAFEVVDLEIKSDDGDEKEEEESKERHPSSNGKDSVTVADEPAGDEADTDDDPYTREELEALIAKNEETPAVALKILKEICADYKIEVKPRTRMTTLVDMILSHQDVLARIGAVGVKVGGEVPSGPAVEIDYDKVAVLVRQEILGLLEPDEPLDTAFGEIVSTLEELATNVETILGSLARLVDGVDEVALDAALDEPEPDLTSENEPEDEPTPTRRRRRI